MSVAPFPAPPPSTDLADAAGRDERVILFCLSCGRSREAQANIFLGLLGCIPFGMLIGKLRCTRCHENIGVLLPWYAPTPRDWIRQYKPDAAVPASYVEPPAREFLFQIEEIDRRGEIFRTRTLTVDLDLANIGFDMLVKTIRPGIDHFQLRDRTRLMRDSMRDLKVV